jgi:hypothetical protein
MSSLLRQRALALSITAAGITMAAACGGDRAGEDTTIQTATADGKISTTSEGGAESRGTSLVRMINALPNGGGATVNADDSLLFSAVDFKSVTPYKEVRENFTRFRLQGTGLDTTIAGNNEIMLDGSHYTLLALPEADGGVRLRVLHDEFERDSTKARLRVIHGLGDVGEIDVSIQGRDGDLFDNVNPTSEAGFSDVEVGSRAVIVKVDGSGKQLIRKEMRFEPGHSYTLVLTSSRAQGTARNAPQRVDAIVVDDRVLDRDADRNNAARMDTGKRGPG